jgi:hypothetical protein
MLRAYYATTETQVCVFCHTPHNATSQQPLWNRERPSTVFNTYTAAQLTTVARAVTAPGAESLMCLSCHDGVSAINVVHNKPAGAATTTITMSGGVTNLAISSTSLGSNLTNDHPISFSYTAAQAEAGATKLFPIATAKGVGVRFFGAKSDMLECSSCHDPHIAYGFDRKGNAIGGDPNLRPFLNVRNDGSFLCFACHNK